MDLTLLSGVVRNRKMAHASSRASALFNQTEESATEPSTTVGKILEMVGRNNFCRKFSLRVHKFSFQWDLVLHLLICIMSLCPFFFTGNRLYSLLPITVWVFYHVLFILGPKQANLVIPGFGKLKHSFKSTVEEFFSPKLLPVLSISFILVALSLGVTGHRLGGPPLCYHPCGTCLSSWQHSITLDDPLADSIDPYRHGCGYANGKELLSYYTMAQTSFLLFCTVVVAMAVCLAWRVADDELEERSAAEAWLKRESPLAFELRGEVIGKFGPPASALRPEGSPAWVFYGITAAVTFTLLGWHNWYVLSPSPSATLLIILNLLTITMTTLILHLGFFGRVIALYSRNYQRVACLTSFLGKSSEKELETWWNCRNFVLNDDLSLDYDIGGLAVSATFLINVFVFFILMTQIYHEGFGAMLEPPGSYCAYACMYVTSCLIKIFSLATTTYEEQHRHVLELQNISARLMSRISAGIEEELAARNSDNNSLPAPLPLLPPNIFTFSDHILSFRTEDYLSRDDGPIFIDTEANSPMLEVERLLSPRAPPAGGLSSSPSKSLLVEEGRKHLFSEDSEGMSSPRDRNKSSDPPLSDIASPSVGLLSPLKPPMVTRQVTYSTENHQRSIAEIISQIRKYDPYPCILGIPVMPALFSTCKFYIFISFLLIGLRTMISCMRMI